MLLAAYLLLPVGRKLVQCKIGLFRVLAKVSKFIYRLELPAQITIHPIFYVFLLKPYNTAGNLCPSYHLSLFQWSVSQSVRWLTFFAMGGGSGA